MQSNLQEVFQSLYLHFPFCEAKCHYCDFYSLAESKVPSSQQQRAYDAIALEVKRHSSHLSQPLKTVFLGGGTPSLVPIDVMANTLGLLDLSEKNIEVTMEGNPSSITAQRAQQWPDLKINRISMGVQALDDQRLSWLGRVHDVKGIFAALEALSESKIPRINIDYILGVPEQTPQMIQRELGGLLDRFPKIGHVSAYLLTLKPGNPKFEQLPDENIQLQHLMTASELLAARGFEHYEISNFAKPGCRSRHNENYWLGGSYLGLGPSAHSFWATQKLRTKNWSHLEKYGQLVFNNHSTWEWQETLTEEQERLEYLMLRLRRSEGIDLAQYELLFRSSLLQQKAKQIERGIHEGLCELSEGRLKLTTRGLFLSDQIISYFA